MIAALVAVLGVPVVVATPASSATPPAPAAPSLTTPVLSARRAPELLRSSIADARIRDAVKETAAKAPDNSCLVVSNAGRPLISQNPEKPVIPASTEKLLTGAAALQGLGATTRLVTVAASGKPVENGVVDGDLYLIGGGDPLLTTNGYKPTFEDPDQVVNDYSQLADRIAAAGVTEIRGDIVGDDSRYDTERWVRSWPTRYQQGGDVGPLSALVVNDGQTGYTTDPDAANKQRKAGDPTVLASQTLKALLAKRGVRVTGDGRAGPAPEQRTEVARLESLTVSDTVAELIADSDNNTAELLTKELGLQRGGTGSTDAGTKAIVDVLHELGFPTQGVSLVDGSGLDTGNRVTCDVLVHALDLLGPDSIVVKNLPVAGQTGTLRKRMKGTPAEGNVRAKTGTLNEVNALAGFATTSGGAHVTFAYVLNGNDPKGAAKLDDFAAVLAGAPDGPPVDQLSPRAPRT